MSPIINECNPNTTGRNIPLLLIVSYYNYCHNYNKPPPRLICNFYIFDIISIAINPS